jgi:putative Holliday junction resolvase
VSEPAGSPAGRCEPGRVVGIDLGAKRIGVAISDGARTVATPIEVVARAKDPAVHRRKLAAIVAEWEATAVVVGLPLSLSGAAGPAAEAALVEVEALRAVLGVPVHVHDERLSTVTAERSLAAQGLDARARREVVDKVAAAVVLQAWLEGEAA